MAPILYYCDMSPAVRAVLLTAKAIDIELDLKEVNLMEKEHLTEEYLMMNPQHTVPTLEDEGYYLWDSHAIAGYLVNKYSDDDSFYPKDPCERGTVDQRLHFDSSILAPQMGAITKSIIFEGEKSISDEIMEKLLEAFGFMEAFLRGHDWMTGNNITIADLCLVANLSSINEIVPIDADDFPKLTAWLERCAALSYYQDANAVGLEKLAAVIKIKMEL